jgi:hypothetical protein
VHETKFTPSVIEPSFGIGRVLYSLLEHSFGVREKDEQRTVLHFKPWIAPTKVAVLPLSKKVRARNGSDFSSCASKASAERERSEQDEECAGAAALLRQKRAESRVASEASKKKKKKLLLLLLFCVRSGQNLSLSGGDPPNLPGGR